MTTRREFLAGLAAMLGTPAWTNAIAADESIRLAASWQTDHGYQVGILEHAEGLSIHAAIDVPTRAHALLREPGGTLLAVARRPGDWLLRWDQHGTPIAWRWIEPRRAFTGHVIRNGDTLYISETDLDTGAGLIGVRDAVTLEKRAEWPTHGIDPHQLAWDAAGNILVANGGVPTQPETGRVKRNLEKMDSSLVRLNTRSGELLGQWRLDDRRLSLRHLAWSDEVLGIALQAEHDDAIAKVAAPVLALFDGARLKTQYAPENLAGYAGDIAPTSTGFAVSCPRAQGIALFSAKGDWLGFSPLAEACALAATPDRLWAGGRLQALAMTTDRQDAHASLPGIRLDNHWIRLAGSQV